LAHAAKTFDHIGELFSGFGPVAVKRMFGGAGIYAGGTMFAIVIDGAIYLKADEHSIPAFEAEGLTPFTYEAKNKRAVMSYWRIPDRLYDDPDELAQWSRQALSAAQRAAASKSRGQTSKIRNVKKGSKA
jgi:DNA transformation protein and related proteins